MRKLALAVALFVTPALFAAQDPGAALGEAKSQLAAKQYVKAYDAAKAGLAAAAGIRDENERKAAMTALNFYAAAAATGTGDTDAARVYIEAFLKLSPNTRRLDPSKFDPKFVALFGAIANPPGDDMWSTIYPGFASVGQSTDAQAVAMIDAAAVEILGTKAEKKEWRTVENGANRETFLQGFWVRRDREPSTPQNEYRDLISRRIAFADTSFASGRDRGALSDRGRVFVLLGRPAFVRRRPINRDDRVSVIGTEVNKQVNGTMEHWSYTREQLPVAYSKETVTYRFVTQTGVGDNTLQKDDVISMNALAKAAELPAKK